MTALTRYDNSFSFQMAVAGKYQMLTLEEEKALGKRHKEGDLEAAKQLILSHLKLVVSIARKYAGYGVPEEDLVQEGTIGLMKAVKSFDIDRGVRLVSYATFHIKAEILNYIVSNWRLIKVATTKPQRKLFFNIRSMRSDESRSLTTKEVDKISEELKVAKEEVKEMELRMSASAYVHLDIPIDEEGELSGEWLEDQDASIESYLEEKEQNERLSWLFKSIDKLDDRRKDIITQRYLSDKPVTLDVLSTKYNISMERVRQIEADTLKKLREMAAETADI